MKTDRLAVVLAIGLVFGAVAAWARVAGGPAPGSCYVTFEGISAVSGKPNRVECADGDACDGDGAVNGSCTFDISVCAFQTDISGCTPQPIKKYRGNGKHLLNLPDVGVSTPTCAASKGVTVRLRGKKKKSAKKTIQLTAQAQSGSPKSDKNKITLVCLKSGTTTTTLPGGGDSCANNDAGGPRELDIQILDHGTDLDNGTTGTSHNFPVTAGSKLVLCLKDCDASTNPKCTATGPTGTGSANGATFGAPLPLFAAGVPVCVVNKFAEDVKGTVDIQTGAYDSMVGGQQTPIHLASTVFSTPANKVCPECKGGGSTVGTSKGTCDTGPNQGQACTVGGTIRVKNPSQGVDQVYVLSADCPPGGDQGAPNGTLDIKLPVTTGEAPPLVGPKPCPGQTVDDGCSTIGATCSVQKNPPTPDVKGGFNQWCCDNACTVPCFPTAANSGDPTHSIVRTGQPVPPTPVWPDPTYPKTSTEVKTAATFCIAATNSNVINGVAGLPGPGAVIFNSSQTLIGNQ